MPPFPWDLCIFLGGIVQLQQQHQQTLFTLNIYSWGTEALTWYQTTFATLH